MRPPWRQDRPDLRFVVYDHTIEGDRAWFRFTLTWTDSDASNAHAGGYAGLSDRGRQARGDLAYVPASRLDMARRRRAGTLDEQARITKKPACSQTQPSAP